MSRKRSWTEKDLRSAVESSTSLRQVVFKLGLIPAGGNYDQLKRYLEEYKLDSTHFKGKAWNKGMKGVYFQPRYDLKNLLMRDVSFQSHSLKSRLFRSGLKDEACEICGWAEKSKDGRLPLELHHINGDNTDNRLENLTILCPNCHSLQPNYRGRKKN